MPKLNSLPWSGGEVPIVYEDNDIIVLNKPAGLLTVPIPKSAAENLFTLLREYVTGRGKIALTVHRIDRYTSGLVLFAKHKAARHQMVHQFLSHTPERVYHALVHGVVKKPEGELIHRMKQIEVSFKNILAAADDPDGAPARLTYKVLEQWEKAALVEIRLDTGFKNQIRAQFAIIGNPLIGDIQYGKKTDSAMLDRQALHAYRLTVQHPSRKAPITFEAPYPDDFKQAGELLRLGLIHDGGDVMATRDDKPMERPRRRPYGEKRVGDKPPGDKPPGRKPLSGGPRSASPFRKSRPAAAPGEKRPDRPARKPRDSGKPGGKPKE